MCHHLFPCGYMVTKSEYDHVDTSIYLLLEDGAADSADRLVADLRRRRSLRGSSIGFHTVQPST